MKKIYPLIFALALLFLTGGCTAYKNISVSNVRLHEFTADSAGRILLDIGFTVNNPTKKAITLTKADISAFIKEIPLANGVLTEPVEIPSGGIYTLSGKYAVKLDNPLLLLSAGLNFNSKEMKSQIDNVTINIEAAIRQGGLKKKFKYRNIPLSDLIK